MIFFKYNSTLVYILYAEEVSMVLFGMKIQHATFESIDGVGTSVLAHAVDIKWLVLKYSQRYCCQEVQTRPKLSPVHCTACPGPGFYMIVFQCSLYSTTLLCIQMSRLPTQPSLCDSSQILRGGGTGGDFIRFREFWPEGTKYEYQAWELSGLEKCECGIVNIHNRAKPAS